MSGAGSRTFMVRVTGGNGDWLVTVYEPDGTQYAKALAPTLDQALSMAVPYMASVALPDSFEAMRERAGR